MNNIENLGLFKNNMHQNLPGRLMRNSKNTTGCPRKKRNYQRQTAWLDFLLMQFKINGNVPTERHSCAPDSCVVFWDTLYFTEMTFENSLF